MEKTNLIRISSNETEKDLFRKASNVIPSERQLDWQKNEMTTFLHFGMNTFTDTEWGDGKAEPNTFAPDNIDAEQWASVISGAGFKGIILTCKHHDGFCLWPSNYTDYSVKNCNWMDGKGDVVRMVSDACRKYGLKFGVYLSPWDRHDSRYGDSDEYNKYFLNQLTELLTQYGEIFEVWFDGACGEGPNGKKQEYDWNAYYSLIRKLQPNAVISIMGPDVRWVGNEAGKGREAEWSVVLGKVNNEELSFANGVVSGKNQEIATDDIIKTATEIGADCLFWSPAQVDTSIRPGWFYHSWENQKVKSLYQLFEIYCSSVGGNAQLLLNIPPNRDGKIDKIDADRITQLGRYITNAFNNNIICSVDDSANNTIKLGLDGVKECNCLVLGEDISKGQHISEFCVKTIIDGNEILLAEHKTIGYKRIVRFDTVATDNLIIEIVGCRGEANICNITAHKIPNISSPATINRDEEGLVTINSAKGAKTFYSIDGGEFLEYVKPFKLIKGGEVIVRSEYSPDNVYGDSVVLATKTFGILKKNCKPFLLNGKTSFSQQVEDMVKGKVDWFTAWSGYPCEFVMDIGEILRVKGIGYLPITNIYDYSSNIYEMGICVSIDGENYTEKFKGELDNIENNPIYRKIEFDTPEECRYIKVVAYRGLNPQKISFGSIDVLV